MVNVNLDLAFLVKNEQVYKKKFQMAFLKDNEMS